MLNKTFNSHAAFTLIDDVDVYGVKRVQTVPGHLIPDHILICGELISQSSALQNQSK